MLVSVVAGFMPFLTQHPHWPVVGAGIFMAYWALIGWIGLRLGYRGLLNTAIVIIALRLVIVYIEVFGDLLSTGVGLIASGVLLIALVWGTGRLIRTAEAIGMTQRRHLILSTLVLILPLLVLGGIILKNERDIASAKTWRVKITGYDPRDLLYGHYLSFRFDWGVSLNARHLRGGTKLLLVSRCPKRINHPPCKPQKLRGGSAMRQPRSHAGRYTCSNGGQSCQNNPDAFDPEATQRYFIPESAATQLNTLLVNRQYILQVDVKIGSSGQHVLGDLYIENVEWRDYLRQHPDAGQPQSVERREHTWRMKITDARLYGAYLVFRLNWGAPLTRSACPTENSCCALCLSEQAGSSQPAISYKTCGAQDQCLESLTLPDATILKHTDSGFDPDGPQRYPMPSQEVAQLAALLAGPPKDMSIDVDDAGLGRSTRFRRSLHRRH